MCFPRKKFTPPTYNMLKKYDTRPNGEGKKVHRLHKDNLGRYNRVEKGLDADPGTLRPRNKSLPNVPDTEDRRRLDVVPILLSKGISPAEIPERKKRK